MPSEVLRALRSQIVGELLPHPRTMYSPGCRARSPAALQEAGDGWELGKGYTGWLPLGTMVPLAPGEPSTASGKAVLRAKARPC